MPKALYVVEPEEFALAAARVLENELVAALEDADFRRRIPGQGDISVCLSGGSTPRPVYETLVQIAGPLFPWGRLYLWLGDERWVSAHHEDSNERMIRHTIMQAPGFDNFSLRTIDRLQDGPEQAARMYEKCLPAHAEFDVMVLGIGADCHTASIFPHTPASRERERKVVYTVGPVEPVHRVTITLPVIAKARRLVTLAYGSQKAAAVAAAIEGDVSYDECPARVARDGIWVLDTGAAAALRGN